MASQILNNACPVPFYQDPRELADLIDRLKTEVKPQMILEIGSLYGGTLWQWMDVFTGATVVSIDMIANSATHPQKAVLEARAQWKAWAKKQFCLLKYYVGPSGSYEVLSAAVQHEPYDFIFVDGGHKYPEVSSDFTNYWPMLRPGGLMAFHDIAYADNDKEIEVGRWWRELKGMNIYRMEEIRHRADGTWGIGLIWKKA